MKQKSNAELLALLVGNDTAKAFASRPLVEILGFAKPRQQKLCEEMTPYVVHPALAAAELFTRCFSEQLSAGDLSLSSPAAVQSFLCAKIGHLEHESFWCLWLDAQNRLIKAEELFRGTTTQTSVYPREVVKQAIVVNATGVIIAHTPPSGFPEPLRADQTHNKCVEESSCVGRCENAQSFRHCRQ